MAETNIAGSVQSNRSDRWFAAVALLAAAWSILLATQNLSHSVWFDESLTARIAREDSVRGVAAQATQRRPYPPLFFFAVHHSLQWRDDETGLRIPAILFGALSVVSLYFLGKALAGAAAGALAALLFVATPGAFRYFVDGNAYTLVVFAATASTLFLYRAAQTDKKTDWLLFAVFTAVGLGTHLLYMFHLGGQVLATLWLRGISVRGGLSKGLKTIWLRDRRFLTTLSIVLGAWLLWAAVYFSFGGPGWSIRMSGRWSLVEAFSIAGLYVGPLSIGSPVQLVLWGLLQLAGVAVGLLHHKKNFYFLCILIVLPLLGIYVSTRMTLQYTAYRYCLGVFPLACILAAYSIHFLTRSSRRWLKAGVVASLTGYVILGNMFLLATDRRKFEYQDWRGVSELLEQRATKADFIAVWPRFGRPPLAYYYKGPAEMQAFRRMEEVRDVIESRLKQPAAGASSVWVILYTFENLNPLISRFTERQEILLDGMIRKLNESLEGSGYFAVRTESFLRVTVVEVRARPRGAQAGSKDGTEGGP